MKLIDLEIGISFQISWLVRLVKFHALLRRRVVIIRARSAYRDISAWKWYEPQYSYKDCAQFA